jgi:GNAT superfamily N-acetyltransferase
VNRIFSEAFTERYHRDGLVGVRVPHLSQAIWRYAVADADGGAMLWRNEAGDVVAFNIAHNSGAEGWMGPLAVASGSQGSGIGKTIVRTATKWLVARNAGVIGLETMPRTMDNIGFYSRLGFEPGMLTITVTLDAQPGDDQMLLLSRLSAAGQDEHVEGCTRLLNSMLAGYDFSREIRLTEEMRLGDTLLLVRSGRIAGFALCHYAPLVEGRSRDEVRVLKLACLRGDERAMIEGIADYTRRCGARRASVRAQTAYRSFYASLIAHGGRVRWTDLRMTARGHDEPVAEHGVVLSNWEI